MHPVRSMMIICLLAALVPASWAAEKGSFGFSVAIEADGFSLNPMNPTLKSATIASVVAGSPADNAGLLKGDQVLEVQGQPVAGAKANDLKPHLSRNVGETVNLKVKKVSGQVLALTLSAAKVAEPK